MGRASWCSSHEVPWYKEVCIGSWLTRLLTPSFEEPFFSFLKGIWCYCVSTAALKILCQINGKRFCFVLFQEIPIEYFDRALVVFVTIMLYSRTGWLIMHGFIFLMLRSFTFVPNELKNCNCFLVCNLLFNIRHFLLVLLLDAQ